MLSKKKIKIMFCIAEYEKGIGHKDLRIVRFYKNDYIRLSLLKSMVYVTLAYVLILALIVMYNMETIISNAIALPYKDIVLWVAGVYVLLVIVYAFISVFIYSRKYNAAWIRVKRYFRYLKYLNKNYQTDDSETAEG